MYDSFGDWLRAARKSIKVTQAELAALAGKHPSDIKQVEAYANTRPHVRKPILEALDILGYNGPPPPEYRIPLKQRHKLQPRPKGVPNTVAKEGKMKGVYRHSKDKWRAQIIANGKKKYYLGTYESPLDAAKAYNEAAIRLHGEYAKLNDIQAPAPKEVVKRVEDEIKKPMMARCGAFKLATDDTIIRGF